MTEVTNIETLKGMGEAQTKVDFGIADALKKDKSSTVSMSGDVLFKDVQLFIPELIINIALLVFGVLGIILMRLISQGWLNSEIQKQVSPIVFDMIVGHVMFIQNVLTIGLAVPIGIMLLLFLFKWYLFYPRGKKQIVIRAWKMGVARIGVEEIKNNYVKFDGKGDNADEMHVNYSAKGIDYYTSRPIILLEEGLSENSPLHRNIVTNEKVKDRGNVNASMFSAALKFADMQNKKAQSFFNNPQNWLLIVIIIGIALIAFFMITKGSPTTAVQGAVAGLTSRSG
jgi:hypothetical protein